MLKIDSHHHLWKYSPGAYPWITEELSAIKHDFFPEDLQPDLEKVGINYTVAVEARSSLFETTFLLEQADVNPFIAGVVGWLDLTDSDIGVHLDWFSRFQKFKGIRYRFENDYEKEIADPQIIKGVKLLQKYNLSFDILCVEKNLPAVIEFINKLDDQKLVLDHIAKPLIKSGTLTPWKENIRILAQNKNVYCKISGLVTEADWNNWKEDDIKPYLDVVFDEFGTERLLFGSDWPVCLLAAGYREVYNLVDHYLQQLSQEEQAKIWGLNAVDFYNLKI